MIYEYPDTLPNDVYQTLAELAVFVCEQGGYTSMKVENKYYGLSSDGITGEITQEEAESS